MVASTDKVVVIERSEANAAFSYELRVVDRTVFDSRYHIGDGTTKAADLTPINPATLIDPS